MLKNLGMFFQLIFQIDIFSTCCKIVHIRVPLNTLDDYLSVVQVVAPWCHCYDCIVEDVVEKVIHALENILKSSDHTWYNGIYKNVANFFHALFFHSFCRTISNEFSHKNMSFFS